MAQPPVDPDAGDETRVEPDRGSTTGTPRWVKVFGAIALVVVALVVILLVFGGGGHGPGRHTAGSSTTSETPESHTGPPPRVTHGEQRP